MSRRFNGSNEGLFVNVAPVLTTPLTMACRFNVDNLTTKFTAMWLGDKDAGNKWYKMVIDGTVSDTVRFFRNSGSGVQVTTGLTSFSVNTWHVGCVRSFADNSVAVTLDGGGKKTNSATRALVAADRFALGYAARSSPIEYFDGMIAEAAIWDVGLTDDEDQMLAASIDFREVRPAALVGYWQLFGRHDPEPDLIGGNDLTLLNTPTADAHPRVIRRPKPLLIFIPSVGGVTQVDGAASLTGAASLAGTARGLLSTGCALVAAATLGGTAQAFKAGAAVLTGAATLTGDARYLAAAAAAFSGAASMAGNASSVAANAAISGAASLTGTAIRVQPAAASLPGAAVASAVASYITTTAAALAGAGALSGEGTTVFDGTELGDVDPPMMSVYIMTGFPGNGSSNARRNPAGKWTLIATGSMGVNPAHRIEVSNDGITWVQLGADITSATVRILELAAPYIRGVASSDNDDSVLTLRLHKYDQSA